MEFEWDDHKKRGQPSDAWFRFRLRGADLRAALHRARRCAVGLWREQDAGCRRSGRLGAVRHVHRSWRGASHHLGPEGESKGAGAMAIVRRSLSALRASARADRTVLDRTSEVDIRRHAREDGETMDADGAAFASAVLPKAVREHLGMTQEAFAKALR